MTIERPGTEEYSTYYHRYVAAVPDGDLLSQLAEQSVDVQRLATTLGEERAGRPYAEGKWSGKDVLQHLADTERVMAYRALRAARGDATALASFDQDEYVRVAGAGNRSLDDILSELAAVRAATIALFAGLDARALARVVTASGQPVTARALAYIIAGHEREHLRILREQPGYVTA